MGSLAGAAEERRQLDHHKLVQTGQVAAFPTALASASGRWHQHVGVDINMWVFAGEGDSTCGPNTTLL
jgi:hypothetical protein